MKVVILCGGKGTRIGGSLVETPKALFEIGGRPILWHLMKSFRAQGLRDFVLCLGHRAASVQAYFLDGASTPETVVCCEDPVEDWTVTMVDTGADTNTGGRLRRIAPFVGGASFIATYGDGLADLDLAELTGFHRDHGRLATLTAVRPWSQFGLLALEDGGRVKRFREKPRLRTWINGGFFVFEPGVFAYLDGDQVLEEAPLRGLAADSQLMAYRHQGFWACMDTYKDLETLNTLWAGGGARWRSWA